MESLRAVFLNIRGVMVLKHKSRGPVLRDAVN